MKIKFTSDSGVLSVSKVVCSVLILAGFIISLQTYAFKFTNLISRSAYKSTAVNNLKAFVHGDPCHPISTEACEHVLVNLPFKLNFEAGADHSLTDKNGIGTGFTMADNYSGTRLAADGVMENPNVPGYQASKLMVSEGKLKITTTKGIASTTTNNQINTLGVKVYSRSKLLIETTIINPFYGSQYQQGGLWFGLNDKTFVKLVVIGNKLELRREINDVSGNASTDQHVTSVIAGLDQQTVRLRLAIDPLNNTAEGFYSTDGDHYINVGAAYATKTLSINGMGLTTGEAYTGIFATHRNGTTAVTYSFEDFSVTSENKAPAIVSAPADQALNAGQSFNFSAGQYIDADAGDILSYTATLADGNALPAWLEFNANNLTFTGTAPETIEPLIIKVTATDQALESVSANFNISVNNAPTIVLAPANQALAARQPFSFSAGQYTDPDADDALVYTASLVDGTALPFWLQFDATNLNFTGTAPAWGTNFAVKVTATDNAQAFISSTFNINISAESALINLTFSEDVANTIKDKNGYGTGFMKVDAYSGTRLTADGKPTNTDLPGYEAGKLTITDGTLQYVTNKGISYVANNNQLNSLGVMIDARNKMVIETSLIKPFNGTQSQQAGLWFGLHDKTFVKLVVTGNKLEMRRELNDVSGASLSTDVHTTAAVAGLDQHVVRLRLEVDPYDNTIEGFYSSDGVNFINVGAAYATKTLSIAGMGLTNNQVYAGIFATHRNATVPVTYSFDDFSVKQVVANQKPLFSAKDLIKSISEADALGAQVETLTATDPDGDVLSYQISSGNTNNAFAIDAQSGIIIIAKALNHHTQSKYVLKVKVTDTGELSDEATVTITVSEGEVASAFTSLTWSTVASQPYTVSEAQGEVVKGKLYSFGGFDSQKSGFTPTSRAYEYDPGNNTWTAIAPMPPMNNTNFGGVTHAGFTNDGTDIYFAGGYTANATGTGQIFGTKEVWKYLLAENRYERLPNLPVSIAAGQLEYLNGKLYHISGTNAARTQDLPDLYVLDLSNLSEGWKSLAGLPNPRQHAGSAVFKGKIYYIGGQTGHDGALVTKKDVHVYDPETDIWTKVADLPVPTNATGRGHISSSVAVAGNRIIVLGGETTHGSQTNMVSAYTPANNTWQNITSLPGGRFSGVAGFLNGELYYTGGSSTNITYKGIPKNSLAFSSASLKYTVEEGKLLETQSVVLTATKDSPEITLTKTSANWLTLPSAELGNLVFGAEQINAALEPGTYQVTVTASADGFASATLQISLTVKADPNKIRINFQPATSAVPTGYVADTGLPYDVSRRFGWIDPDTKEPKTNSSTRLRSGSSLEIRLRTVAFLQGTGPANWEYTLPNGLYNVTVSAGDASFIDSKHQLNVEGVAAISGFIPTADQKFNAATVTVEVTDGKLTVDPVEGTNSKINYIIISPATSGFDIIPPTAKINYKGSKQTNNAYKNQVLVSVDALDEGGSGINTIEYSLNRGPFTVYNAPLLISEVGSYAIQAKVTDKNTNQTITKLDTFSVAKSSINNTYMVLENLDKFSSSDRLSFSLIQMPWRRTNTDGTYTPYNQNHNKVKLRINNKGTEALIIDQISLSDNSAWKIAQFKNINYDTSAFDANTTLPLTLNSKAYVDVVVEFIAKDQDTRVKIFNDTLYINSNDNLTPNKKVVLHGLWQLKGESNNEPYAQEIIKAFGFKTKVGYNYSDGANTGNSVIANSDEIMAPYFQRADASRPVYVIQMAAYHGCCNDIEVFQWHVKGSTAAVNVFGHNGLDGQSILPRKNGSSTALAEGTFNPSGAFGIKVKNSYSDRSKNYQSKIGMRIWKAIDANGNIIPNAYIIGADYLGTSFTNYDYQDNVYYISNVKPEEGTAHYTELAAMPSAVDFGSVMANESKTLPIQLRNSGQVYGDGSSDPVVQLSRVELVGADLSQVAEFSFDAPASSSLSPQASTTLTVRLTPQQRGLKNAALLVHYTNGPSPLRIPLYGLANDANFDINVVKRIKGAADTDLSIAMSIDENGQKTNVQTWEKDTDYRKGSIKMDKQVVAGPIASTDADVLYQSYLSAAVDLAQTRVEVPLVNGTYLVRLHLVENFFPTTGSRVVSINLENQLRLSNLDIHREVGYRAALVKDYEVVVTDGMLNLEGNPTVNRLALAGLEIYQAQARETGSRLSQSPIAARASEGAQLQVYPNPVRPGGQVQLAISGFGAQQPLSVEVQDVLGRVVNSQQVVTDEKGKAQAKLSPAGSSPRGVYLIRVQGAGSKLTGKLVVE